MKKNIFRAFALMTIVGLTSSCNNSAPKMDEEPEVAATSSDGMRIAYIEIDTLTAQYEFAKEKSLELEKSPTVSILPACAAARAAATERISGSSGEPRRPARPRMAAWTAACISNCLAVRAASATSSAEAPGSTMRMLSSMLRE